MRRQMSKVAWFGALALVLGSLVGTHASTEKERKESGEKERREAGWVAGDFHQHTTYTDGSNSFATVMGQSDRFGLDWWANSEHGGRFGTDARGPLADGTGAAPYDANGGHLWTDTVFYPSNPILGDLAGDKSATRMWRWQSLSQYAFEDVMAARALYRKPVLQSYEWNVPTHEHCSLGLIAGQFPHNPTEATAAAIAQFEYLFDANDTDVNGGLAQGWTGKSTANTHQKAVEALAWLQRNHPKASYAVFAHPERRGPAASGGYDINDFRDFNNAAPDVAFGFESMPGHQKEPGRGGYGSAAFGGTFGGVGVYAAKVGGLWDAMLGEGRRWWLFASSDFHNTIGDFWPGEYQKTYTYVEDKRDARAIVNGLRSGRSFVVTGDLIDALEFRAQYGSEKATMGEVLPVARRQRPGNQVKLTVKFKSPRANNNGDTVVVDHIDVIAGSITGFTTPGTEAYRTIGSDAKVVATLTSNDWTVDAEGYHVAHVFLRIDRSTFFRLRGTNLAPNTPNETDAAGNPLADSLMNPNTPAKAWADLWFYSNPIFVRVSNR